MCGRVACTLAPDDVCRTCRRQQGKDKWSQPNWKPAPDGGKYYPSYNAAPTNYLPVMLSKKHFEDGKATSECKLEKFSEPELVEGEIPSQFVIQPMRWGLIPPWHKGEVKSSGYNTINARSDGMCSKSTYKGPLEKGRRCVVLVDGYYEWQKKDQPYYIYHPEEGSTVEIKSEVKEERHDADDVPKKKLLTLAGIFDIYRPENGDPPLYSYSMITVDAHKSLSWLHHRMPAVLTTEDEVEQWLDFGKVPLNKAVDLIRPVENIKHHPVSKVVNKVQNKTPDCVKPVDLSKPSAGSSFMSAWLAKGQKRKSSDGPVEVKEEDKSSSIKLDPDEPDIKKKKT